MRELVKWAAAFLVTALVGAVVGTLLSPSLADYFAIGQPDIRYTNDQHTGGPVL